MQLHAGSTTALNHTSLAPRADWPCARLVRLGVLEPPSANDQDFGSEGPCSGPRRFRPRHLRRSGAHTDFGAARVTAYSTRDPGLGAPAQQRRSANKQKEAPPSGGAVAECAGRADGGVVQSPHWVVTASDQNRLPSCSQLVAYRAIGAALSCNSTVTTHIRTCFTGCPCPRATPPAPAPVPAAALPLPEPLPPPLPVPVPVTPHRTASASNPSLFPGKREFRRRDKPPKRAPETEVRRLRDGAPKRKPAKWRALEAENLRNRATAWWGWKGSNLPPDQDRVFAHRY